MRGASTTASANATLVATPSTIDFGTVADNQTANQKVTLANTGSDPVQITALDVSNAAFKVTDQSALPVNLAAGRSISFNVRFTPNGTTESTGQVSVSATSIASAAVSSRVELHGRGIKHGLLSSISCANGSMSGPGSDTCTVKLSSPAHGKSVDVSISSSNTVIKVPTSVRVDAGSTTANFVAIVWPFTKPETVTLTASRRDDSTTTAIKLESASASLSDMPSVSALSCSNNSFVGPQTTNCTVSLSSPALSGGMGVALKSDDGAVKVPGSVMVAAGAKTASFTTTVEPVGTAQTATITASANSSSRSFALQLKAATNSLSLSATSLAFGSVAVGTEVTKSVTVTANGGLAVSLKADSVSGTGFSVSGGGIPVTIEPGQSAVLSVHYAPTTASSSTGQLTISSSAPTATVSLSGTGATSAPAISAFSCSSTSITGATADTCTVNLSGSAPSGGTNVALASSSSSVKVPSSVTVPATATSASFTASVASVTTAQSVTLKASTASSSQTVSLKLAAAAAAGLSVNSTSISFGSTTLNTPTSQSLTLTATGSSSITVKSATITGTGFSVSGQTFPLTLNAGQSANLDLQFDPTTAGAVTGNLTISSNSSSNPTTVVSLSGTGTAHQVSLSWDAPTSGSDPIAGYNVYRSGGGSTAYSQLNSKIDSGTTYTDTSVKSGQTYEYEVKTVDTAGHESSPSNPTTVTIP